MATVKVVDLIARAQTLLVDTTATRWAATELQYWLNDSYREIVNIRPDSNAQTGTFTCAASYRQDITTQFSTALKLLEIIANVAATSSKKAIRLIDRKSLDDQRPGWFTETATVNIEKYMYDPRLPTEFLVYPPATALAQLEVLYSVVPTPHTLSAGQLVDPANTEVIKINDSYANAILDYILYRAYTKDADQPNNASRAVAHYQAFQASLGVKSQSDAASQPGVA